MAGETSTGIIAQLDLAQLGLVSKLPKRGQEPDTAKLTVHGAPKPANPTAGPHSLTVQVPHDDDTVVNLGQRCSLIHDTGITGRTKSHVHWETRETAPTMVSLGAGPAPATPWSVCTAPTVGSPWEVPALFGGKTLDAMQGYTMATGGEAWQQSAESHAVVSTNGDAVLRAEKQGTAVVQSDAGDAEVNAKNHVVINASQLVGIRADPDLQVDEHVYGGIWPAKNQLVAVHKNNAKAIGKKLKIVQSVYGIVTGFAKSLFTAAENKPGWLLDSSIGAAKVIADTIKLKNTVTRMSQQTVPGQVKISAKSDVSITGDRAAGMYGFESASVSSTLSASVFGGTTSVKALTFASMWAGVDSSVKALRRASLEGEFGDVKVAGKKGAKLEARAGTAQVAGKKGAELKSDEGPTSVYGHSQAYVGCSHAYGLIARKEDAWFGWVESPKEFNSAAPRDNYGVRVTKEFTDLASGDAQIRVMSNGTIRFIGKSAMSVNLAGRTIMTFDKTKILLDP